MFLTNNPSHSFSRVRSPAISGVHYKQCLLPKSRGDKTQVILSTSKSRGDMFPCPPTDLRPCVTLLLSSALCISLLTHISSHKTSVHQDFTTMIIFDQLVVESLNTSVRYNGGLDPLVVSNFNFFIFSDLKAFRYLTEVTRIIQETRENNSCSIK